MHFFNQATRLEAEVEDLRKQLSDLQAKYQTMLTVSSVLSVLVSFSVLSGKLPVHICKGNYIALKFPLNFFLYVVYLNILLHYYLLN